jgi:hypothetical protein
VPHHHLLRRRRRLRLRHHLQRHQWAAPAHIDGTTAIQSVSCTSASYCQAVDNAGKALSYNGTAWSAATTIANRSIYSVSCPTATFCAAVGAPGLRRHLQRHHLGRPRRHRLHQQPPRRLVPDHQFLCPSRRVRLRPHLQRDHLERPQNIDAGHALYSVSCPNASFCKAVDNAGDAFTYNGTTWSAAVNIDSTRLISAISCPTTTFCAATDNSGYATTYNGTTWTAPNHIDGTNNLVSVSCVTATFCKAVDRSVTQPASRRRPYWQLTRGWQDHRATGRIAPLAYPQELARDSEPSEAVRSSVVIRVAGCGVAICLFPNEVLRRPPCPASHGKSTTTWGGQTGPTFRFGHGVDG